ncbi:MAG: helicase HerA-like domain-containing protein [Cellvibrionaceae bacterium]
MNDAVIEFLIGGNSDKQVKQNAKMANRHGLITGATGTGKTVTLQTLAESFSNMGVPVFLSDIKGDVSGLGKPAKPHPKIDERVETIGIDNYQMKACPVVFWDFFGKKGHPLRTTVSEIGPLLWSSLLELNDTQTGVLYSCFKIADDNGWLLLDLKDLRSMLIWIGDNTAELKSEYGNISKASIGAIQRDLLVLEEQGAELFLGEPAINLEDLIRTDLSGNGIINIFDASKIIQTSPKLYSTFLLWLLSELFENLPEVGDAEKPKFVMFFDEAHLLFDDAPKVLVDKIEQVVRLIRSKGVGVYFITQSPLDVPESILGQLGLKVQHALRAFTPKDKKTVKTVAETFPENPDIDTEACITELGIGEALVSVLAEKGRPTPVERILIRPPESRIGPMTDEERDELIQRSPYKGRYDAEVDRESAYEILKKRADENKLAEEKNAAVKTASKKAGGRKRQTATEAFFKSAARAVGSQLGRTIIRGILGSILK